ncbi:Exportin-5 [Trichinella nativa]|uniref:Exportin-5 n=1 Tax=Trichinella nativa TaxID=6335 RepID=A0A0V1LNH2_9BILA|nr:Exportin-5 [Trichinella nativa]
MNENLPVTGDILPDLISAIECNFQPTTDYNMRSASYMLIESVKESNQCLEIGFRMLDICFSIYVQQCGLQFILHAIRTKWPSLPPVVQQLSKDRLINCLLSSPANNDIRSTPAIMEGFAQCIVAIVECDWPQKWKSFIEDCRSISKIGPIQAIVVLSVIGRLIEDVMEFELIEDPSRNKELRTVVLDSASQFFDLTLEMIKQSNAGEIPPSCAESSVRQRMLEKSYHLLNSLIASLNPRPHLFTKFVDKILEPARDAFKSGNIPVAEIAISCLESVFPRKASAKNYKPVVIFFESGRLNFAYEFIMMISLLPFDQQNYTLLKAATHLFFDIATCFCSFWVGCFELFEIEDCIDNWDSIFRLMLSLLKHPSTYCRMWCSLIFNSMKNCKKVYKIERFAPILTELFKYIPKATLKNGEPSKAVEPFRAYAKFDYETNTAFLIDYHRKFCLLFPCAFSRSETLVVDSGLREACEVFVGDWVASNWRRAYSVVMGWLDEILKNPAEASNDECFMTTAKVIHVVLDSLVDVIEDVKKTEYTIIQAKVDAVMNALQNCQVVNVVQALISVLSSLFPILDVSDPRIPGILCKLISSLTLGIDDPEMAEVRHHFTYLFIKMATVHQAHLIAHIELIWKEISAVAGQLSDHQKCAVVEGLFALCKLFKNFEQYAQLMSVTLQQTVEFWASAEIMTAVSKPENFLIYIGLGDPLTNNDSLNLVYHTRRKQFSFHVKILHSVISRLEVPTEIEVRMSVKFVCLVCFSVCFFLIQDAKTGGFCITDVQGNLRICHPAAELFQMMFPTLFTFLRCLKGIYSVSSLKVVHATYDKAKLFDLTDAEKSAVMGKPHETKKFQDMQRQEVFYEKMKLFLAELSDHLQHLLIRCVFAFDWQFFALPNAASYVEHGIFGDLENLMDYRLRLFLRRVITPLSNSTTEVQCYFVNGLAKLVEHLNDRLIARWHLIMKKENACEFDDEQTKQQIFTENVVSLLTRELALFLRSLLLQQDPEKPRATPKAVELPEFNSSAMDTDANDEQTSSSNALSFLGKSLLQREVNCYASLVSLLLNMLSWRESVAAFHISQVAGLAILEALQSNGILDEESFKHAYAFILGAMPQQCLNPEFVGRLYDLAVQLYEHFRNIYPNAAQTVLLQTTECSLGDLQAFDKKILNALENPDFKSCNKVTLKVKRDWFKSLIKKFLKPLKTYQVRQIFGELPPLQRPSPQPPSNDPAFPFDHFAKFTQALKVL